MISLTRRLFQTLRHGKQDAQFIEEMRVALSDGILTDDERHLLLQRHSDLGASDAWRTVAPELFAAAVRGALSGGTISKEAEAELHEIRRYLELDDEGAANGLRLIREGVDERRRRQDLADAVNRNRAWVAALEAGTAMPIEVANLALRKGEEAFIEIPGTILEERVVGRRYEGGSRGVSIRVAKGVSFRVGASRGQLVSETGVVEISSGRFVITDRRIVFIGDQKSYSDSFDKLVEINPMPSGIRYSVQNSQKPRLIRYDVTGYAEAVVAAFNGCAKRFSSK